MFLLWDLFTKKSTLSEEGYLSLFEKKQPIKPEARQKKSFQYLQDLNEYLKDSSQPSKENTWIEAIKAAKDSIDNEGISKEKVVQEILTVKKRAELMLDYQDDRGMTALHHLVQLGDEWFPVVNELVNAYDELNELSDDQGQFPMGLAADTKTYDIFMLLYRRNWQHAPAALVQCLQPEYQTQFQDKDANDILRFIKDNLDPKKVKLPALVAAHNNLRAIYLNLKVFGKDHYALFDKLEGPDSLLEGQAEEIIHDVVSKMSKEDLHQRFGKEQDMLIHLACENNARIAVKALLKRVAIVSGGDPQTAMRDHLNKKFALYTAYKLASPELKQEIDGTIIPSILKELELENRLDSPSMTNP